MARAGRPKKNEQFVVVERNKKMIDMRKNGYPVKYIASYHGLSTSQTWKILTKEMEKL